MEEVVYAPEIYDVTTQREAEKVILTEEGGLTTEQRWRIETPWLIDLIKNEMPPLQDRLVLDYGCGIGRLARPMIGILKCRVVGVDISANMRGLASSLVGDERFWAMSPSMLRLYGPKVDHAIAVWVLQHCPRPERDISLICDAMEPGGMLLVVNNLKRCVPVKGGRWADDGVDIRALLAERFDECKISPIDRAILPGDAGKRCFWAIYAKK